MTCVALKKTGKTDGIKKSDHWTQTMCFLNETVRGIAMILFLGFDVALHAAPLNYSGIIRLSQCAPTGTWAKGPASRPAGAGRFTGRRVFSLGESVSNSPPARRRELEGGRTGAPL